MVINKQSRHEMPFRRIICTPTSAFAKKETVNPVSWTQYHEGLRYRDGAAFHASHLADDAIHGRRHR
jgi:hypothetical protein